MPDITIISHVANACSLSFDDPQLAVAWVRTLVGVMDPEVFMSLFKTLNPGDVDAVSNAQHLMDYCLGAGA